jgi:hypothetical protein
MHSLIAVVIAVTDTGVRASYSFIGSKEADTTNGIK